MTNQVSISHDPDNDAFFLDSQVQSPNTTLSVLVKAVAFQVISDAKREVKAPIEIWNEIEKFWEKEKEESLQINIKNDRIEYLN